METQKVCEEINMDISKLRTQVTGRVIGPEDGDYSKVRTVFYGGD